MSGPSWPESRNAAVASSSASAASAPRAAAPVSPATTPAPARLRIPSRALSSPIETIHSTPVETRGHATGDGRPQLSPTMIERCGPGTAVISPAPAETWMQLASAGSTPTSAPFHGRLR